MATIKPYFSIIIPALNEEKYLPRLLDDLTQQVDQSFEVIFVDGRSTDKTVAVAKKYEKMLPKLTILTSPKRHVSTQRNLGASISQAPYLLFMDADDRVEESFLLGIHYHLLSQHPTIFTTWCTADSNRPAYKSIATAINLVVEAGKILEYEVAIGAFIGCRKDVFGKVGGFDEKLVYGEDSDFTQRAVRLGYTFTILHDPRYIFSFRRIRREGTVRSVQHNANLFIKQMAGKGQNIQRSEYPMGGNAKKPKNLSRSTQSLEHSLELLTRRNKPTKKLRVYLKEFLES